MIQSNGTVEDYSKYIWNALNSTAFQILEDSSTGDEDAVATPITQCISESAQLQLRNKLQFVARDILSMNSECCVAAIDRLKSWLDLKNAEFLDPDLVVETVCSDNSKVLSTRLNNSKPPSSKSRVLSVKLLIKSRSGCTESNFRTIRGFKETCIFRSIGNTQNLRTTLRWTYVFTTGMNYDIYDDILNSMTAAGLIQDWGAFLKYVGDYECILRNVLKLTGDRSIVKLHSIGKKTCNSSKYVKTPKVFQLRQPVLLTVAEILTVDRMLEVATNISFDETMFTNTFVMLVNSRVKNITRHLENHRRVADVELYNASRYKHNIVSTCKRRYTKKMIIMKLAGIRYEYILEHHGAFQQIARKTTYTPKTVDYKTLLHKIDTYKILKTTRDAYTLQNIQSVEIRNSYIDFYNKVLCNHLDQVKDFYNQEAWIITLATEQLLLVLDVYLGITRLIYKIPKGFNKGQFIWGGKDLK